MIPIATMKEINWTDEKTNKPLYPAYFIRHKLLGELVMGFKGEREEAAFDHFLLWDQTDGKMRCTCDRRYKEARTLICGDTLCENCIATSMYSGKCIQCKQKVLGYSSRDYLICRIEKLSRLFQHEDDQYDKMASLLLYHNRQHKAELKGKIVEDDIDVKSYQFTDVNILKSQLLQYYSKKKRVRKEARNKYIDPKYWNVSAITNMDTLFYGLDISDIDLSLWDVSKVTSMQSMFSGCRGFSKGKLEGWNVSNVENMMYMFYNTGFNENIMAWNVSKVTSMKSMFQDATHFNQPIGFWKEKTANVMDMSNMFDGAIAFNQSLENWNVSKVETMCYMFNNATQFNNELGKWDVSKVKQMQGMFQGASVFNQPIEEWKVGKVENMEKMFNNARSFNQSIGKWGDKLGNVTKMNEMFSGATAFRHSLKAWQVTVSLNDMGFSAMYDDEDKPTTLYASRKHSDQSIFKRVQERKRSLEVPVLKDERVFIELSDSESHTSAEKHEVDKTIVDITASSDTRSFYTVQQWMQEHNNEDSITYVFQTLSKTSIRNSRTRETTFQNIYGEREDAINYDAMKRLMTPGEWVSDQTINFVIEHIFVRYYTYPNSFLPLYSFLVNDGKVTPSLLQRKLDKHMSRLQKRFESKGWSLSLRQTKRLLVPCNIINNHWVLAVVFVPEGVVAFYDSLGNVYSEKKLKIATMLQDVWRFITGGIGDLMVENYGCDKNYPTKGIQTNDSSCGIYVIESARCAAQGRPIDLGSQVSYIEDGAARQHIGQEIMDIVFNFK
jgi:hypothetical protein